ncbi:hypothetical protein QQ045_002776 [Rhodiola kirilowii]
MDEHVWPDPRVSSAPGVKDCPLEADSLLIRVDGSWSADSSLAGMGAVAMDHEGVVLWTLALWTRSGCYASEVEGMALLHALHLVTSLKFPKARFETDSTEVYKAITTGIGLDDWCCSLSKAVLELLNENPSWQVLLIRREDNSLTDFMASKARRESWTWDSRVSVPRCISGLV